MECGICYLGAFTNGVILSGVTNGVILSGASLMRQSKGGRAKSRPALAVLVLAALTACGGYNGGVTLPQIQCLYNGQSQLIYPIPNATNVPNAPGQIVFAVSRLFPSTFQVLVHNDPNPNTATAGSSGFFQQINQSQVPQPSATPNISNPLYESATVNATFPHAHVLRFPQRHTRRLHADLRRLVHNPMKYSNATVAALLLLTACTQGGQQQSAIGRSTLVIAQQREPMSLNPALENGQSQTQWGELLFSFLVKYDNHGQLVPDAATAVPTLANGGISADGRTVTYHLKKNIRFADGQPLTASDCVWSVNAINNPANNVQSRYGYDRIASAQAPNATTLVLHLKNRFRRCSPS